MSSSSAAAAGTREPPGDDLDQALALDVGPVGAERGAAVASAACELRAGELGVVAQPSPCWTPTCGANSQRH